MKDPKQGGPASNKENCRPGTTAYQVPRWRPELAKTVYTIKMNLLQAELFPEMPECRKAHEMLKGILKAEPNWCKNLNAAHQVNHELHQVLPLIATDEYLCALLEYELNRKKEPESGPLIIELFEPTEIAQLLDRQRGASGASWQRQDRLRAEQVLKRLYEVRDGGWTYERALVRLKRYYLVFHAVVIGIFLVLLGKVITSADGSVGQLLDQLLLVTLAGALGSWLAAMLKLRDAVVRLNDLLAVIVVAVAQALIGASLGLVAWLILRSGVQISGVVQIGGGSSAGWETYALVAFAGGFSEPFSLRLIARFIDTG